MSEHTNSTAKIYNSIRWRKLRKRIIRRDKGLCQHCLIDNQYVPGDEVDHIKPLADYTELNPFDPDNLQLLCLKHHQLKTANESKQRALKGKVDTLWV